MMILDVSMWNRSLLAYLVSPHGCAFSTWREWTGPQKGAELVQLRWGFPPGRPKGPRSTAPDDLVWVGLMICVRRRTQLARYSRDVCTFLIELTREVLGVVLCVGSPRCDMSFFVKEDNDPGLFTRL